MSIKISVIIPCFNGADSILACIESALNQSHRNLEIIVVDDGSVDGSAAVLDHLSAGNSRVSVIRQKNQGPGAARNAALERATGEYITFLDADDTLEPKAMERMLGADGAPSADWIIAAYFNNDNPVLDGLGIRTNEDLAYSKTDFKQVLKQFLKSPNGRSSFLYVWGKLFKRDIISRHRLSFDPDLRVAEDMLFNAQYLVYANRIQYIHQPVYRYAVGHGNSAGHQILYQPLNFLASYTPLSVLFQSTSDRQLLKHWVVFFAIKTVFQLVIMQHKAKAPLNIKPAISKILRAPQVRASLPAYQPGPQDSRLVYWGMRAGGVQAVIWGCRAKIKYGLR